MAEKTPEQWRRAIRRWSWVGGVVGLVAGLVIPPAAGEGLAQLPGSVAFYLPLGVAMALILWASTYRYDFPKVWGWGAMGLTFLLVGVLMAAGIGAGCLQGICDGGSP